MQRTRRGCTRALGELQITGYHAVSLTFSRPLLFLLRSIGLSAISSMRTPGTRARRRRNYGTGTLATRTVTLVEPPAWHSPVEYRRKPAPQKAIATSLARPPRTSSNFTICRARRERAHHRRAWKRATSLPTELAELERRLLAPGRREFDDSAVEAAVAVAASLPLLILLLLLLPSLLFHSFVRRRPKITPAGPLTRSRDSPARSADPRRRRRSIPPRGETRFPPSDGHTKNRPSLSPLTRFLVRRARICDIVASGG